MLEFLVLLPFLLYAAFLIWACYSYFTTAYARLRRWAEENGLRILRRRYLHYPECAEPFPCTRWGGNQAVYEVVVEDAAGHCRRAWLCLGSWWRGLASDKVAVR